MLEVDSIAWRERFRLNSCGADPIDTVTTHLSLLLLSRCSED
jgi:hypothetical protein